MIAYFTDTYTPFGLDYSSIYKMIIQPVDALVRNGAMSSAGTTLTEKLNIFPRYQ